MGGDQPRHDDLRVVGNHVPGHGRLDRTHGVDGVQHLLVGQVVRRAAHQGQHVGDVIGSHQRPDDVGRRSAVDGQHGPQQLTTHRRDRCQQ